MFYTRIPCPTWVDHNPAYLNSSTKYLPVIGWIVGGAYATVTILSSYLFSPVISILVGLGASILLTGAFHEDGFADTCDGFGGGWTKEKILAIMKDSRVGTYGVVGIILMLSIKISATLDLFTLVHKIIFVLLVISSHAVSRTMAVLVISMLKYARDETDASKAKPVSMGIGRLDLSLALLFGLTPLLLLAQMTSPFMLLAILPMITITMYLTWYFKKWIGGYTGDCLGATQQINEVVFLLSIIMIWKFL